MTLRILRNGKVSARKQQSTCNNQQNFETLINKTDACWLWTGPQHKDGYGKFYLEDWGQRAHRVSRQYYVGSIPPGLQIDHICRVKLCVNPEHLRLVNNKQNHENHGGANKNSTSGVRGVCWDKRWSHWSVQVTHYGKRYYGGSHKELHDAEMAAKSLRNSLFTHNERDRVA